MLRKLSLHGFKSFCDRTEITLGSGITAIVGPNGCGKSNLADALRWVLGEQNPRVLRSARSQDIIFAGTQSRKAMGMAEVKLLFDSIGGNSETEILRRVARDGTGEYRLDGKTCRWKDVVETLAGTGLSHTGYVVIGQGTIHELASGRPEDRRAWIEEASGVAKVRLDKRDMESKLEAARADIARLTDLAFELESRKQQLAQDKELALRYKELSAKRRELDLSMWLYQYDEESRKASGVARRLERYRAELRDAELSIPRLGQEEESLRQKREPLEQRILQLQSRREALAEDLLALEKMRDAARGQVVVLKRELEARTARKAAISRDLDRLAAEEKALGERHSVAKALHEEASLAVAEAEKKRQSSEAQRKELADRVIGIRTEVVGLTTEQNSVQRSKEDLRHRLEDVRNERRVLFDYLAQSGREKERLEKDLAASSAKRTEAGERAAEARRRQEELESSAAQVKAQIDRELSAEKNLGARLSAVKARRKLLEDMERSFEGYSQGPRAVLEGRQRGVLSGIQGAVGELFSCEARYISALSAAVGGAAENIIVSDEAAAKSAIAHLKQGRSGRATFLPMSILRPRGLSPAAEAALGRCPGVRPLISVVSFPPEMESAARYLVGRIVLADTLDLGLRFMRESGWATRVVTLTGESLEPGGAISGGEAPRSEALFRRKHELAEVRESDRTLSSELEAVLSRRKSLERDLQSLSAQASDARLQATAAGAEAARLTEVCKSLESQIRATEAQMKEREAREPVLKEREEGLGAELDRVTAREREIAEGMAERQEKLLALEERMRESAAEDRQTEARLRELIRRREEALSDLGAIQRRLEGLAGERVTHQRSLEEEEKEIARQGSLLESSALEDKELGEKIGVLDRDVSSLAAEIAAAEAERESLTSRLTAISQELQRLSREKASLAARLEEAEVEIEATRRSLEEVADLIEQEFGMRELDEVEHPRVSRAEGLPMAEELDNAIRGLGAVNLKAEEEWTDVSERIDLLNIEKEDVLGAIDEINRAREIVEKEIETRFVETFGLVASSFREIFQELFGGGRGDLVLIEDSLGVEVIAEPPGRRQKHLNLLSGGERSLCGIALIFAILSVKASPLIVLDEADTALDESNIVRFSQFLKRYSEDTQFVVITHQKATMEAADLLYGVTMEEPGVSRVFGMRLENR
ncbi:MAG: chromosome segregation protein SMC [Bacillota bacterium]